MEKIGIRDLRLADVVRLFDGPFGDAIVKQIDGNRVTLERPYMAHADFATTAGVICWIGHEDVRIELTRTEPVRLILRGPELK